MKTWRIPVSWEVSGMVDITASTLDEAIEIARDDDGVIPCPDDSEYISGSWKVDDFDIKMIRSYWNNGQKDEEND